MYVEISMWCKVVVMFKAATMKELMIICRRGVSSSLGGQAVGCRAHDMVIAIVQLVYVHG